MGRMKATTGIVSLAVCIAMTAGRAEAQPMPPAGPALPPPFSPYLNLVRPSTNPGISYFGIVRPQFQVANQIQTLQTQSTMFGPLAGSATETDQPFVTGNAFGFQNYRAYFQNQFTAGSSGLLGAGRRYPTTSGAGISVGGASPFNQYMPQAGAGIPSRRR